MEDNKIETQSSTDKVDDVNNPLSCAGCKYHNTTDDDLCVTCGNEYKNKAT